MRVAPRTARAVALALLLAAAVPRLAAQAAPVVAEEIPTGSADWYDRQAQAAVDRHGYEAAAKLLDEAKRAFPDDARFNLALASLYYQEQLWRLALDEFLAAERKRPLESEPCARVGRCLGKLDRNREAVAWLEQSLERWPGDAALVDDLGWMYFKVHRYADGVRLLESAVRDAGTSADLAMTLGTLYSGMGDYAASSRHYRAAIELAADEDSRYVASIAWYNLSLLERRFFAYRAALHATDESLAAEDLASGHLARGELLECRMDYRGALAEYETALALDETPLARLALAELHRRFGRLDLALRYADEALAEDDPSWLLYYGSDVARYRLDLHDTLADIHEGMARLALGRPTSGPLERLGELLAAAASGVRGWYHRTRSRLYAAEVGRACLAEGAEEDGAAHLQLATEAYPAIALRWLERARAVETARAPHAEVLYRIDEGTLRRSPAVIGEAIARLDPVWERRYLADALVESVRLASRGADRAERREAANRLYAVNPGALLPHGIGLPLVVRFAGAWPGRERRAVRRLLARSGSELATETGDGFRWVLVLDRTGEGRVDFTLAEGGTGPAAAAGSVTPAGGASPAGGALPAGGLRRQAADVVVAVLAECYSVQ